MKGAITISIATALGIGIPIVMTLSGFFISQVKEVNQEVQEVKKDTSRQGERISAVESTTANIDKRLDRIESKLDQVISQKR
ncbi:hypothetical protein C4544_05220 [candidate division WS5 bacterium]|uniref:Uncharacterized protein n=1 Tax=candidate division WS5 bacterium TaxID=2093353 RepID=A0A419DBE8_9BACT|nr:MAG: hypothetical protein C4544_05220 [candidate division WS5 bacterium]